MSAVSINLCMSPLIQGIIQHPMRIITPRIIIHDVKAEAIILLHLPKHCSIKFENGSLIPEFSASFSASVIKPCKALVMVPSLHWLNLHLNQQWPQAQVGSGWESVDN